MKLEPMRVATLSAAAAPYNPRRISEHDLAALAESMRRFGVVEPVVYNTRTDTIVGGHQRVKAAMRLGLDELPVVNVDLDPTQERALNLALNRISGQWDDEALAAVLAELPDDLLTATGFTDAELRRLFDEDDPTAGLTGEPQLDPELSFKVVVDVVDEQAQRELTSRLESEGYTCNMLIS